MKLKITVHGVAYEVDVEILDAGDEFPVGGPLPAMHPLMPPTGAPYPQAAPVPAPRHTPAPAAGAGGSVTSPIAGTIVELKCAPGDSVAEGQVLLVIEAMKMKTSIAAPAAGTVKTIPVKAGDTVTEGQTLVQFS